MVKEEKQEENKFSISSKRHISLNHPPVENKPSISCVWKLAHESLPSFHAKYNLLFVQILPPPPWKDSLFGIEWRIIHYSLIMTKYAKKGSKLGGGGEWEEGKKEENIK